MNSLSRVANASHGTRSAPSRGEEARLFARLRRKIWLATLRQLLRDSFLRVLLICGLTLGFWGLMFILFYEGFSLLTAAISHPPTLARTVHAVYNVFFLSLLAMLTVSSGILYYAAIYKSPEVHLLLTVPVRTDRLAMDKFVESTLLAWVWVQGQEVNTLMVERGYGCVLYIPPNGEDRVDEFNGLQALAKAAKRGMWGACAEVACD